MKIQVSQNKQSKITITNLESANIPLATNSIRIQLTEDATKWNECLNPLIFGMMHKTFFDLDLRKKLRIPLPNESENLLMYILLATNFIISIKRVNLGEGEICYSDHYFNRPSWSPLNIGRFNKKTQEWFSKSIKYLEEDKYLRASPGMLMGMLNAASTTLGLAATMYEVNHLTSKIVTMRSSDDSMTIIVASDTKSLIEALTAHLRSLKMLSINISRDKSFCFGENFGEYTSWYQDGSFISQYGVETSTLRPGGSNPHDDFYNIAKTTAVNQQKLEINPLGAEAKIILGINNCRRLWRIEKRKFQSEESINIKVRLLSDGGLNPWNSMKCHLEETSLRLAECRNEHEMNYLYKVRNPDNPFSPRATEDISYSIEIGQLTTKQIENPRTAFCYIKRSNRTSKGKTLIKLQ